VNFKHNPTDECSTSSSIQNNFLFEKPNASRPWKTSKTQRGMERSNNAENGDNGPYRSTHSCPTPVNFLTREFFANDWSLSSVSLPNTPFFAKLPRAGRLGYSKRITTVGGSRHSRHHNTVLHPPRGSARLALPLNTGLGYGTMRN